MVVVVRPIGIDFVVMMTPDHCHQVPSYRSKIFPCHRKPSYVLPYVRCVVEVVSWIDEKGTARAVTLGALTSKRARGRPSPPGFILYLIFALYGIICVSDNMIAFIAIFAFTLYLEPETTITIKTQIVYK